MGSLPDYRPKAFKVESRFSDEDIDRLHATYGFQDVRTLSTRLEHIADVWSNFPARQTARWHRDLLLKLTKRTGPFLEVLSKLGSREYVAIYDNSSQLLDMEKLLSQVEKLSSGLDRLQPSLKATKLSPGRKGGDDAGAFLVGYLKQLYWRETGKHDRYWHHDDPPYYQGKLISFIEDVCAIIEAPLKNTFIGDTLNEVFKASDAKSS